MALAHRVEWFHRQKALEPLSRYLSERKPVADSEEETRAALERWADRYDKARGG